MSIDLGGKLLLVGAGKMGGAMLDGWLARGLDPKSIVIQDPAPPAEVAEAIARAGVAVVPRVDALDMPPAIILMAVKPQVMEEVFAPVAKLAGPKTLVLSIAAGRTIASFEKHLPPGTAVVRAMPNTPAAIGRGITVCCPNAAATAGQKEQCNTLLSAVGEVGWVDDEGLIDPVTAVSGSGPAYVFLLAE